MDPVVYKGALAAKMYKEGHEVIPAFPLFRLDHALGGALKKAGVNVWEESADEVYHEAMLDTDEGDIEWLAPVMTREPAALRMYFEYAHSNPVFSNDFQNNEVTLAFPVYGRPGDYAALTLPTEAVGQMLADNLDDLDKVLDVMRSNPDLAEYDGVPRNLIQRMWENARDAETVFYEATGWSPREKDEYKNNARQVTKKPSTAPAEDLVLSAQQSFDRTATKEEREELIKQWRSGPGFNKLNLN